jgi:hypothetical protein
VFSSPLKYVKPDVLTAQIVGPLDACPVVKSANPFMTALATVVNAVGNVPAFEVELAGADTVPHWRITPFGSRVQPFAARLCVYPEVPAVSIQISPAAEAVGVEPVIKT